MDRKSQVILQKPKHSKLTHCGSYALIFSVLYQYHRIIPVTYRFRIFGLVMNDKMFLYVLAFQLALSQSYQTLTPAVCGLLSGTLYRTDIANIKKWRFPVLFQKLSTRFIKPYLVSPPIARSAATTPVPRPIITGILPVDTMMTDGLRNRRVAATTATTATATTATTTAAAATTANTTGASDTAVAEGAASVRVYQNENKLPNVVIG